MAGNICQHEGINITYSWYVVAQGNEKGERYMCQHCATDLSDMGYRVTLGGSNETLSYPLQPIDRRQIIYGGVMTTS